MRISDWSSDVCSSDLMIRRVRRPGMNDVGGFSIAACRRRAPGTHVRLVEVRRLHVSHVPGEGATGVVWQLRERLLRWSPRAASCGARRRSEEHTSELQSLMRISYAVFCLKKKNNNKNKRK